MTTMDHSPSPGFTPEGMGDFQIPTSDTLQEWVLAVPSDLPHAHNGNNAAAETAPSPNDHSPEAPGSPPGLSDLSAPRLHPKDVKWQGDGQAAQETPELADKARGIVINNETPPEELERLSRDLDPRVRYVASLALTNNYKRSWNDQLKVVVYTLIHHPDNP